jgi:hypothetical protein
MKTSLKSGVASFAHLLGIPTNASAKAEEDDDKKKDPDAKKAEESDDDKKKKDDADTKKAEGDDDEKKDPDAKASDEDEDPEKCEDNDDKKKARARGVKAERSRWSTVLAHKNAGEGRVASAVHLLVTTDMPSDQIVGLLGTFPATTATKRGGALDALMAREPKLNPGTGGSEQPGEPTAKSVAANIAAAAKKARGEA